MVKKMSKQVRARPSSATPVVLFDLARDFPAGYAPSGTNSLLTVTLPASGDEYRWIFSYIHWSYSDTPTDGTLTITDGTVTETIYITAGGPGFLPFANAFVEGAAVTITLSAGGAGINSSLAVVGARLV